MIAAAVEARGRTTTFAASPLAPPAPPGAPRFADLLQRAPATHGVLARPPEAAPAPAETAKPEAAPPDADDTTPSQAQDAARNAAAKAGTKMAPRAREKAPPASPPAPPVHIPDDAARSDAIARDATDATATGDGAPDSAATAPAAALRDWLAALKLPQSDADPAAGDRAADGTGAAAALAPGTAPGDATSTRGAAVDARHRRDEAAADDDKALAAVGGTREPAPGTAAELFSAAGEHRAERAGATPLQAVAASNPLAGAAGALTRGVDAAIAPAPIALPTPLHAPDFAQALGAQVSVLAKDGVQQAELHLNPADMGPISVQIEIDGAQARVDFQAHAAATREVIERGLPELASALREQGLTLSGGGVSQQAPGRGSDDGREASGSAGRGRGRAMQGVAATAAAPRRVAVLGAPGGVDLYV